MKIVIIGNGKVGSSIAASLVSEGHDVTVVDCNAQKLQKLQNSLDVMCIEGNGATAVTQLEASVDKAGLVIAVTPHDELNILCCIIARHLGTARTILRVRTPEYYRQMHLIRDDLHLSSVINPELATADEIARVLIFPPAVKVEVFQKGKVELVEHLLPSSSTLSGYSLHDIYKKYKIKLLICAVQRNNEVFIPDGNFVLQPNDRINIAATHKDIERFFKISGHMKSKIRTVMIIGGGSVCYYLSLRLLGVGMKVKIIEKDYNRCTRMAELLPEAVVICGDGTEQELLIEEGIQCVDAFVALTGIDEENMLIALYAKENTNAKVVVKINRDNYAFLAKELGLDCVIYPKYLTTSHVLSYVRSRENAEGSEIESLYHIIGDKVEAIEFHVYNNIPTLIGIPLRDVRLRKNILICTIVRKREIIIPDGNTTIELGDSVVIVSKEHHFSSIKDILA